MRGATLCSRAVYTAILCCERTRTCCASVPPLCTTPSALCSYQRAMGLTFAQPKGFNNKYEDLDCHG